MSGKIKILGIAFLAVMLLCGTAIAQGPGGGNHSGSGPHTEESELNSGPGEHGRFNGFGPEHFARFRMMFRHMNLSGEQIAEIESIMETARVEISEITEESGRPEDPALFMDAFTSPTLTVDDLEEVIGHNAEAREEVQDVFLQAMVDIHDVLTVEQLESMAVMAEEHAAGMTDDSVTERGSGR